MSTTPPIEPTPDDARPTEAYPAQPSPVVPPAPEAQPTEVLPPIGGYGDAYAQSVPPAPYDAAQAPYGQPGVAPQSYAAAPTPDTRSKTVAWTALILAVVGTLLTFGGFVPVPWVGLVAVLLGGLVLLAGFIVSIVGLVGKRHGGTPLSITALVLTVVGAVVGVFALALSLVFIGLSAAGSSSSDLLPGTQVSEEATADEGVEDEILEEEFDVSGSEEAFLAQVRPEITQLFIEFDPTITAEDVEFAFSDDVLLNIGYALLATGDAGIDAIVAETIDAAGEDAGAEELRAVYRAIYEAAQAHLQ